jgi:hypothetical protein
MANEIQIPQNVVIKSQYVNKFELWLASPEKYLAWAKNEGTNSLNIYGRSYLKTASNRKKLAAFVLLARKYGMIEVFIDYRGVDEIVNWRAYFKEYPTAVYKIYPVTEIEPYISKKYAEFYAAIKEMNKLSTDFNLIGASYMGQPTQECWDMIVKYCQRIYLSKYISMAVYNGGKSFNYVSGRWDKIALAAKKNNKLNFPVVYIVSLEKKSWGAANDFQGDLYIKNSFYGSTYDKDVSDYNSKCSNETKMYTDLIGTCMFDFEYCIKARPIKP